MQFRPELQDDGWITSWLRSSGPIFPGDHGEEETPVPIPNTAVKLLSGDGTVVKAMGE